MNPRIYTPPMELPATGPVVFLAGPIQGTWDWQAPAGAKLCALDPEVIVANPRRATRFAKGDERAYAEQVDWETYARRAAMLRGVTIYWLAAETERIEGRQFAQTTRVELGESLVHAAQGNAKLVIGHEPGFSGVRYIKRRCAELCPEVPFVESLEDACSAAIELLPR